MLYENYLDVDARKKIKWQQQRKKCNRCGFNLYTLKDGPYELHHIDGNRKNTTDKNEEILCCNCHGLTKNFRHRGTKHSKETKQKISRKLMGNQNSKYTPLAQPERAMGF